MQEIMQQVRQLQIRTRRQVSDVLAGAYLSVFKGAGVEFDEVRPYVPGDDVRTIDWNVTARTGVPHIKRFVEERELSIVLLVDVSASMDTGSCRSKQAVAAELGALVTFSAIANQDKVGLMLFSHQNHLLIPPRKGQKHGLRIVRELLSPNTEIPQVEKCWSWWRQWAKWSRQSRTPHPRQTDLRSGLDFCQQVLKRRSIVFVVSDCRDENFWKSLQALNQRHDVVLVQVLDPIEKSLPDTGLIDVVDIESGQWMSLDAGSPQWQQFQRQEHQQWLDDVAERSARAGIDHIVLSTEKPAIEPLLSFMRRRERRGR